MEGKAPDDDVPNNSLTPSQPSNPPTKPPFNPKPTPILPRK